MLVPFTPARRPTASALCDYLCDGGIFVTLAVSATGKEELAFQFQCTREEAEANYASLAPMLAELSHRFRTDTAFAAAMSAYLHDCGAVYRMTPAKRPLSAA